MILMTLVPVILVFVVVIVTLNNILNTSVTNHTQEIIRITAEQISENAALRIDKFEMLQGYVSRTLAQLDRESPDAKENAQELLELLITMSPDTHFAWFVFEPGYFEGEGRFYHEAFRMPMGFIRTSDTLSDAFLDTGEWYQIPLLSGEVYYNTEKFIYSQSEGPINVINIVHPIVVDGVTIGCVGMDIRYEAILRVENLANADAPQKIMAVSQDGTVLFSFEGEDVGRTLQDFGFAPDSALYAALNQNDIWIDEIDSPFFEGKSVAALYPFNIGSMAGNAYLYRGVSRDALYAKYQNSMELIIASGLLGGILIGFFVFVSTRRIGQYFKLVMEQFGRAANLDSDSAQTEWIPASPTRIYELDQMLNSLSELMLHMQKVHYLRIEAIKSRNKHEKLLASTQAQTTFFASMSHEIRTPMNAVIGIAEIMLTKGGLSPEQEKEVRDIRTASNSLLSLIDDIMDVSKMETGKITLNAESYDLEALLDNVASLSSHLAAEAGLQFRLRVESSLPKCLYGDEARVRQVLLNLLGNAMKYTPRGSVTLRVAMQGSTMRFDVTDTGIGIREKDFENIFESFKRVDVMRNRKITGTGLGLPISRHLAEAMSGSLTVRSKYGEGSTFTVTFPVFLGDEKKLKPAGAAPKVRFTDDLQILIVDDNRVNLNVSSGLLKVIFDVTCDLALSGQESIDMVQKKTYDLVFMDHMMPHIDGAEATRRIRGLGPAHRVLPIIALTANAVIGTKEELLNAGMDDFLSKPIRREELQEIMVKWVPKNRQIQLSETDATVASDPAFSTPTPDVSVSSVPVPAELAPVFAAAAPAEKPGATQNSNIIALAESGLLDVHAGLENIGFDEEMYVEAIMILCRTIPETLTQMREALPKGDIGNFGIYAHGIKGSFMSVGSNTLAKRALALEQAAKRDDTAFCEADFPGFAEAVEIFRNTVLRIAPNAETETEPEGVESVGMADNGTTISLFGMLGKALKDHHYEAIMEASAMLKQMKHSTEATAVLKQVCQAIDNFDYETAATLLDAYLQ